MDLRYKALRNNWYPERYHGRKKQKTFFEGWYFKLECPEQAFTLALIAGISMNKTGEREAFIQYLIKPGGESVYHAFKLDEFKASENEFNLSIGSNQFSMDGIKLELPELKGNLVLVNHQRWPKSILKPNIMGPLGYWPGLNCYHAIVSMRNSIKGQLKYKDQTIVLDDGLGYIEKDWGKSFPEKHIWMQCNRFSNQQTSLSLAIAPVQILGQSVLAYAVILKLNHRDYLFTTYHLSKFKGSGDAEDLRLEFKSRQHQLEIRASMKDSQAMRIPNLEGMKGLVHESLEASIEFVLKDRTDSAIIAKDRSAEAAMELSGKWF